MIALLYSSYALLYHARSLETFNRRARARYFDSLCIAYVQIIAHFYGEPAARSVRIRVAASLSPRKRASFPRIATTTILPFRGRKGF